MNKTAVIAGLLVFVFAAPFVGAAQRAITVSSLNKAYEAKVEAIDAQITTLTELKTNRVVKPNTFDIEGMQIQGKINGLLEDKHILEVSHSLLVDAFE